MDGVVLYQVIVAECWYAGLQFRKLKSMDHLKHTDRDVGEGNLKATNHLRYD